MDIVRWPATGINERVPGIHSLLACFLTAIGATTAPRFEAIVAFIDRWARLLCEN